MAAVTLMPVVVVNLVTIAADLQAGTAGRRLLAGVDSRWLVAPLEAALAGLLLAGRYGQVVVLRYVMLGVRRFRRGGGAGASGLAPPCSPPAWSRRCRGAPTW